MGTVDGNLYIGVPATIPMLDRCGTCGRRLRRKTVCIESKKHICKKCCDLHVDNCYYHMFCWTKLLA